MSELNKAIAQLSGRPVYSFFKYLPDPVVQQPGDLVPAGSLKPTNANGVSVEASKYVARPVYLTTPVQLSQYELANLRRAANQLPANTRFVEIPSQIAVRATLLGASSVPVDFAKAPTGFHAIPAVEAAAAAAPKSGFIRSIGNFFAPWAATIATGQGKMTPVIFAAVFGVAWWYDQIYTDNKFITDMPWTRIVWPDDFAAMQRHIINPGARLYGVEPVEIVPPESVVEQGAIAGVPTAVKRRSLL